MRRLLWLLMADAGAAALSAADPPRFDPVQPDLFGAPGALTNAWADYDNDGDLDLFVGFNRPGLNRLYRNDQGVFRDVAAEVGLADPDPTRGAAWGDFNADGFLDLYVGFDGSPTGRNRLYRSNGGKTFTNVAAEAHVDSFGATRQISWVDFDADGDADLFVAFRAGQNKLYRNDASTFTDVGAAMGLADPRHTVGAAWFDYDEDGDLDVFVANQDGGTNALFRNDRTTFTDVAKELGIDAAGRAPANGSVGACVGDYDTDGRLDLFVANYGPSSLLRNTGGRFEDVAPRLGLAIDQHNDACAWGDIDHDGRPDLYVSAFLAGTLRYRDYFFHNDGTAFTDIMPPAIAAHDADHGIQWADFDKDGDLDLALADSDPRGSHSLFRNMLAPDVSARALQVMVLDRAGHVTRAGSEVRLYRAGTRQVLGAALVDTGSGYDSQSATPVHFGLARLEHVDVEAISAPGYARTVTRQANVNPAEYRGRWLTVRVP